MSSHVKTLDSLTDRAQAKLSKDKAVALILPIELALPPNPLVHPEEEARAKRFVRQPDAVAHLAGRHLLRAMLGITPPVKPFRMTSRGRPEFTGSGPAFSISHSGQYVAVAVSPEGLIGIDVQSRFPLGELDALIERVCHPNEARWLSQQDHRLTGFLQIWTRKEAVLKATGVGITMELTSIDTDPEREIGAELTESCLRVSSLSLPDGGLAIAAQRSVTILRPGAKEMLLE